MTARPSTSKSPLLFFFLVFALSIPLSLAGAAIGLELLPGLPVSSLVVTFCPLIAAVILFRRENGAAGVTGLLKRAFDYQRIGAKLWYAPMVLLMPGVMVLEYGLLRWMGSPVPIPQFPIWATPVVFVAYFIAALGEELGWMGYAVDSMQARWNALQTGILLGLAWAAWHIIPVVQVGRSPVWIAWQCLFWVASRILIVWLYNNTGKSLFSMALFHSTFGLFWILLTATDNLQKATPYYDPRLAAIIAISYVAIVTLLWGSKTLAQYRFARSSESHVADKNQLVTDGK